MKQLHVHLGGQMLSNICPQSRSLVEICIQALIKLNIHYFWETVGLLSTQPETQVHQCLLRVVVTPILQADPVVSWSLAPHCFVLISAGI